LYIASCCRPFPPSDIATEGGDEGKLEAGDIASGDSNGDPEVIGVELMIVEVHMDVIRGTESNKKVIGSQSR
jgi:hypothetical protein